MRHDDIVCTDRCSCSCPPCRVRQNIVVVVINGSSRRPGPDRRISENEPRETCREEDADEAAARGRRLTVGWVEREGHGPVMAISRTDSHRALRSHALTLACGQPSRVWVHVRRRPASVRVCPIRYRACACVIGLQSLFGASTICSSEKLPENNGQRYRFPAVVVLCCCCLNARRCFPLRPTPPIAHMIRYYTGRFNEHAHVSFCIICWRIYSGYMIF